MKLSRPQVEESEDDSTFWLITYSDMITLLLTFFLLMFSFTLMTQEKQEELLRMLNKVEKSKNEEKKKPEVDLEAKAREMAAQLESSWMESSEKEVTVGLPSGLTFASGDATLTATAKEPIEKIAAILATVPNVVRIEGHTDNVPMRGGKFASNWHLSAGRAQSVLKLFLEKGLDPKRLQVVGFGETRPRQGNETDEGRAANRRIEIKLLRAER